MDVFCDQDKTAREWAIKQGHSEVASLLEEYERAWESGEGGERVCEFLASKGLVDRSPEGVARREEERRREEEDKAHIRSLQVFINFVSCVIIV